MKCPNCGTENSESARYCQMCARPLGPSYQAPPPQQPGPTPGVWIFAVVAVVILIVIVLAVALLYVSSPRADLRAELSYTASSSFFGGTVSVYGTIYNDGEEDGSGTVILRIYDGYEWHQYSKATGTIEAGGSESFYWFGVFETLDQDNVELDYSVR